MVAPATHDPAPGPVPPEQFAAGLHRDGRSKDEILKALLARRVEPGRAAEIVSAVTSGDGIECSRCKALILRSSAGLSTSGEPLCPSCVEREEVGQWEQRARDQLGPEHSTRRCRRCSKPAMSCFDVGQVRWRRGERMNTYTFQCSACGHRFTGYGGPMPWVLSIGMIGGAIAVLVLRWPPGGGDTVGIVACLAIGLFFAYKILVWRLHPVVP